MWLLFYVYRCILQESDSDSCQYSPSSNGIDNLSDLAAYEDEDMDLEVH